MDPSEVELVDADDISDCTESDQGSCDYENDSVHIATDNGSLHLPPVARINSSTFLTASEDFSPTHTPHYTPPRRSELLDWARRVASATAQWGDECASWEGVLDDKLAPPTPEPPKPIPPKLAPMTPEVKSTAASSDDAPKHKDDSDDDELAQLTGFDEDGDAIDTEGLVSNMPPASAQRRYNMTARRESLLQAPGRRFSLLDDGTSGGGDMVEDPDAQYYRGVQGRANFWNIRRMMHDRPVDAEKVQGWVEADYEAALKSQRGRKSKARCEGAAARAYLKAIDQDKSWSCEACGTPNRVGLYACVKCGGSVREAEEERTPEEDDDEPVVKFSMSPKKGPSSPRLLPLNPRPTMLQVDFFDQFCPPISVTIRNQPPPSACRALVYPPPKKTKQKKTDQWVARARSPGAFAFRQLRRRAGDSLAPLAARTSSAASR